MENGGNKVEWKMENEDFSDWCTYLEDDGARKELLYRTDLDYAASRIKDRPFTASICPSSPVNHPLSKPEKKW